MIKPIEWLGDRLKILDQSQLPEHEKYLELRDYRDVIHAIKDLKVRGAPAIGIAAAYGIVLGANAITGDKRSSFLKELDTVIAEIAASRPTAVNIFYAANQMKQAASGKGSPAVIRTRLTAVAIGLQKHEDRAMAKLSRHGAQLLEDGFTVLTHCNTGQLATGVKYGTALGIVKAAVKQGKRISVYVDETRPVLQGARLTTWELLKMKIPATLITDSMAGYFLHRHRINCVIVGADRIAANGDAANKIGTYTLAVTARENHIPFYVAAPLSSIDVSINSGDEIIIEERNPEEVSMIKGIRIAPIGIRVANPAFDVTPNKYITAIVTETGIIRAPFKNNIRSIFQEGN